MAASTLSEQLAASGPTIYRRLDRLEAADLVVERTEPDVEGGHHRTVYEPNLRRVRIDLADGEFSIEVTREDMADRFTSIVEGI